MSNILCSYAPNPHIRLIMYLLDFALDQGADVGLMVEELEADPEVGSLLGDLYEEWMME